MVLGAWFLVLAGFVVLKARQPKWEYPRPPLADETTWDRYADAA
jgi:hypothetical protein